MKKILFSLAFIVSAGLNAFTVDDLEQSIITSNTKEVQEILQTAHIDSSQYSRLLMLADDIVQQRKSKYESHFNKNKSISVLFELSKNKFVAVLSGLGIIIASYLADSRVHRSFYKCKYEHHVSDFHMQPIDFPVFGPYYTKPCLFAALLGGGTIIGTVLKHFYDVKKLYDDSILIKQLICMANTSYNN